MVDGTNRTNFEDFQRPDDRWQNWVDINDAGWQTRQVGNEKAKQQVVTCNVAMLCFALQNQSRAKLYKAKQTNAKQSKSNIKQSKAKATV